MQGYSVVPEDKASLAHGVPLSQEQGIGALTLPGFLAEVCARYGPREAIAQPRPSGEVERWTYSTLYARSMEVARSLAASGVGKGTRVGILVTNRAEFVSCAFGVAMAGGIVTALSTFSTPSELDHMIAASACSVLIVEPEVLKKDFVEIICGLCPDVAAARPGAIRSYRYPYLRHAIALDRDKPAGPFEPWTDFLARGQGVSPKLIEARTAQITPADPGVLLFSSGSTGKPKGILSAHRGVSVQLWRWRRIFEIRDHDRVLTANGLFWSGQFGMAIGGTFSAGATLVMQSFFQPEPTLELIEAEKITVPIAWPHQWEQLSTAANWNDVDLSSLHHVGPDNPLRKHPTVNTDWVEPTRIYGNTETFTLSAAYEAGTSEHILKGAYGFPLPGMTIKIVDPITGEILPMGERGEMAVKGVTLMLGYVGVPLDETLDEQGFFRTGDGGYLDPDGRVYWEGRINDIIKTGGANVSPVEVDARIIRHPAVKLVQTVGVPDHLLGELVVACVVLHEGASLSEAEIKAFAREELASYKVPRRVLFLDESELAQTGTAKVKTADLRKIASNRLTG